MKKVPCNGCTVCCQKDLIFLRPQLGDDPNKYDCEFVAGRYLLKHKKNGDCIYLDRNKGCTIHGRAPFVCRNLDCRYIFDLPKDVFKNAVKRGLLNKRFVKAAKKIKGKENV